MLIVFSTLLPTTGASQAQPYPTVPVILICTEDDGDIDLEVRLPDYIPYGPDRFEVHDLIIKDGNDVELPVDCLKQAVLLLENHRFSLHFILSGQTLHKVTGISFSAKARIPYVPMMLAFRMARPSLQGKWAVVQNDSRRVRELPIELSLEPAASAPGVRLTFWVVPVDANWLLLDRAHLVEQTSQKGWNRWEATASGSGGTVLGTGEWGVLSYNPAEGLEFPDAKIGPANLLRVKAVGLIEGKRYTFEWEVAKSPDGKWQVTKKPDYDDVFKRGVPAEK